MANADTTNIHNQAARCRVAGLLVRATVNELDALWQSLDPQPGVEKVRGLKTGLAMVRGRIGGGSAFNLGEATVTRASVHLPSGTIGYAHALCTGRKQAWLAPIWTHSD